MGGLDYSKWDHLDDSDEDEADAKASPKASAVIPERTVKSTVSAQPSASSGSRPSAGTADKRGRSSQRFAPVEEDQDSARKAAAEVSAAISSASAAMSASTEACRAAELAVSTATEAAHEAERGAGSTVPAEANDWTAMSWLAREVHSAREEAREAEGAAAAAAAEAALREAAVRERAPGPPPTDQASSTVADPSNPASAHSTEGSRILTAGAGGGSGGSLAGGHVATAGGAASRHWPPTSSGAPAAQGRTAIDYSKWDLGDDSNWRW